MAARLKPSMDTVTASGPKAGNIAATTMPETADENTWLHPSTAEAEPACACIGSSAAWVALALTSPRVKPPIMMNGT